MSCRSEHRKTMVVWKDGLKTLGQKNMDEVEDRLKMEGLV